ncbi:bifunctional 4-hydroxy-2-oxoglutarate aldolase/2-dehydro-3-deoxy-phosphogluconate aldolase [Pseudarthrobacter sp. B907]|uniref:bifunctional 4-hydroxy-2-oxoglutarate aldolase/2-dehydro-3-deoxy-phosphogluconate aldolase n=1 Tax=Pseudarthrobacter sp. B907 TaxID=3158261 RepID=UPI0032DB9EDA
MADLLKLRQAGILAVVRAPSTESAIRGAAALLEGGVTGLEITYSTPDAPAVIRALRAEYGDKVYLGAGTVLTRGQAEDAVDAGAEFLVSPGTVAETVTAMKSTGSLVMAGALTPTEVLTAVGLGADVVKIFPASLGGPSYFRALRGPLPDVPLMPTGGVTPGNIGEWFDAGAVAVGAGGDLCSTADLAAGRYDVVREKALNFSAALERTLA